MDPAYFDFANLTPEEREGGVPIAWSSRDALIPCTSIPTAHFSENPTWATVAGAIVRWGDGRIDEIMEAWRAHVEVDIWLSDHSVNEEAAKRASYFRLHGARVPVVLPNWIFELHVIPKMLGTPDHDSDEDPTPMLDQEFNPVLTHAKQNFLVVVLDWSEPAEQAEAAFVNRGSGKVVYVTIDDYVFSVHMGVAIREAVDGDKQVLI